LLQQYKTRKFLKNKLKFSVTNKGPNL